MSSTGRDTHGAGRLDLSTVLPPTAIVTAPLAELPSNSELLLDIFFYAVKSERRPMIPLFLGHICRNWRSLAFNTNAL